MTVMASGVREMRVHLCWSPYLACARPLLVPSSCFSCEPFSLESRDFSTLPQRKQRSTWIPKAHDSSSIRGKLRASDTIWKAMLGLSLTGLSLVPLLIRAKTQCMTLASPQSRKTQFIYFGKRRGICHDKGNINGRYR